VINEKELSQLRGPGENWFCFQTSDSKWHAVYGKYQNNNYEIVFHYVVDTTYKISRIHEPVDTAILDSYSRALFTAQSQIQTFEDSMQIAFNPYVRQNDDMTFTVWIFPAFQRNSTAVYGGEFIYTIDATGTQILRDDSYFQGNFRMFKVDKPREIWLEYPELEKPTLGGVFFVWYYKKYFTNIFLETKNYVTTTIKNVDGSYSWVHVDKEKK